MLRQIRMVHTLKPTDRQTISALRLASAALGDPVTYVLDGRFHFRLDGRWSVAISPDDAERFRVSVFRDGRERATLWARQEDWDRLADLVLSAKAEVRALVA